MEYQRIDTKHKIDIVDERGFYILTNKSILFCEYEKLHDHNVIADLTGIDISQVKSYRALNKIFILTKDGLVKTFTVEDNEVKKMKFKKHQLHSDDTIQSIHFTTNLQIATRNKIYFSGQAALSKTKEEVISEIINDFIVMHYKKTITVFRNNKEGKNKQLQNCEITYKHKFNKAVVSVESKNSNDILKLIIICEDANVHFIELNTSTKETISSRSLKWLGNRPPSCVSFSHLSDKVYLGGQEGVLMIWDVRSGFKQTIPRFGAKIVNIVETVHLDIIITSDIGSIYYIRALDNVVVDRLSLCGHHKDASKLKEFPSISEKVVGGELLNGLYQIYDVIKNKELYCIDFHQANSTYNTTLSLQRNTPMNTIELVDAIHINKKLFYAFYNMRTHESKIPIVRILGSDNGVMVYKEDIKMRHLNRVLYDENDKRFILIMDVKIYSKQKKVIPTNKERRVLLQHGYEMELDNIEKLE